MALIDTRAELYEAGAPACARLDVLRGAPIAAGVEIATRTLSPSLIVCDEIGSREEADAILSVAGCGVPIVASAHAGEERELWARPPIRRLLEAGIFGATLGIAATENGLVYTENRVGEREACFA